MMRVALVWLVALCPLLCGGGPAPCCHDAEDADAATPPAGTTCFCSGTSLPTLALGAAPVVSMAPAYDADDDVTLDAGRGGLPINDTRGWPTRLDEAGVVPLLI